MPDWGIALIGVAGIIVGTIITEARHWLDRKERYHIMTFDKRLEVAQEVVYKCLNIAIAMTPVKLKGVFELKQLLQNIEETREWLSHNNLYLEDSAQLSIMIFLNFVIDYAEKYEKGELTGTDDEKVERIGREIDKAMNTISKSIGVKYMPVIKEQLKS